MPHLLRRTTTAAATLALGLGVLAPATATSPTQQRVPNRIALPDGFQPEGIATDGSTAYVGSRADGDLERLDLRTGRSTKLAEGPGTPSLGLKVDSQHRLFVAGGSGGDLRVVDTRSGKTLASYTLETGTAFINDVVLTPDAAYVTDSANAQLFALPIGPDGKLPAQSDVRRIPLTGDWRQVDGNNANGITTTPDGRALLVVNSSTGELHRVDPTTGRTQRIKTATLTNGDGMLREGRTLYVVRNRDNLIAVLRLDRDGTHASTFGTITSKRFDVPSTVARSGDSFYLPNARFTTPATPTTAYDVTRVRID